MHALLQPRLPQHRGRGCVGQQRVHRRAHPRRRPAGHKEVLNGAGLHAGTRGAVRCGARDGWVAWLRGGRGTVHSTAWSRCGRHTAYSGPRWSRRGGGGARWPLGTTCSLMCMLRVHRPSASSTHELVVGAAVPCAPHARNIPHSFPPSVLRTTHSNNARRLSSRGQRLHVHAQHAVAVAKDNVREVPGGAEGVGAGGRQHTTHNATQRNAAPHSTQHACARAARSVGVCRWARRQVRSGHGTQTSS